MKLNKILCIALSTTALATSVQAAELRMTWWGGDSRHEATQAALKACGDKHGHVIEPEFTPWKGHLDLVADYLANETEADIMQINWPWLPLFSPDGEGFADLSDFSDVIDLSNWTPDQLESSTFGGRLNGLPVSTTGRLLMVNKAMFDKAGAAIPSTWAEMIALTPKIKAALGDDAYPFTSSGLDATLIISLAATQKTGKSLIDPDTRTVSWSQGELAEALGFYKSLVENGVIEDWESAETNGAGALNKDPRWANGMIGSSYQWDSTISKISKPLDENQELVPIKAPAVEGATSDGIFRKPSMVFAISTHSDNPEAAAQIVNCLMNEKEGVSALGTTRGLPASKAAKQHLAEAGAISDVIAGANEIVMSSSGPQVHPTVEHPDVKEIFRTFVEAYALGEIDADTAASQIIENINTTLVEIYS